jgi:hypothetical protein
MLLSFRNSKCSRILHNFAAYITSISLASWHLQESVTASGNNIEGVLSSLTSMLELQRLAMHDRPCSVERRVAGTAIASVTV